MTLVWVLTIGCALSLIYGIISLIINIKNRQGSRIVLSISTIVSSIFFLVWGISVITNGQIFNSINRTNNKVENVVTVYDNAGKEIKKYDGKFEVKTKSGLVTFIDENGKHHVISANAGTVIVDEK